MTLGEFDAGGRRKPVAKLGEDVGLDVDQVILAIGQEPEYPFENDGVPLTKRGLIEVIRGKTETKVPMVFAGGDVVSGPDTVVNAIAAGHDAADEIDRAIRAKNGEPAFVRPGIDIEIPMSAEEEIKEAERACTPEADCRERITDFREVELGLSEDQAFRESCRCLRCDVKA
jgi:NADH-quinone oxidoreductase subunit F